MSLGERFVLSAIVLSYSSRSLIMIRALSTGTLVNSADTSYEHSTSSSSTLTCLISSENWWAFFTWCSVFPTSGRSSCARCFAQL